MSDMSSGTSSAIYVPWLPCRKKKSRLLSVRLPQGIQLRILRYLGRIRSNRCRGNPRRARCRSRLRGKRWRVHPRKVICLVFGLIDFLIRTVSVPSTLLARFREWKPLSLSIAEHGRKTEKNFLLKTPAGHGTGLDFRWQELGQ